MSEVNAESLTFSISRVSTQMVAALQISPLLEEGLTRLDTTYRV